MEFLYVMEESQISHITTTVQALLISLLLISVTGVFVLIDLADSEFIDRYRYTTDIHRAFDNTSQLMGVLHESQSFPKDPKIYNNFRQECGFDKLSESTLAEVQGFSTRCLVMLGGMYRYAEDSNASRVVYEILPKLQKNFQNLNKSFEELEKYLAQLPGAPHKFSKLDRYNKPIMEVIESELQIKKTKVFGFTINAKHSTYVIPLTTLIILALICSFMEQLKSIQSGQLRHVFIYHNGFGSRLLRYVLAGMITMINIVLVLQYIGLFFDKSFSGWRLEYIFSFVAFVNIIIFMWRKKNGSNVALNSV